MGRDQIFRYIITVCAQRMGSQTFRRVSTEVVPQKEEASGEKTVRRHGVFKGFC